MDDAATSLDHTPLTIATPHDSSVMDVMSVIQNLVMNPNFDADKLVTIVDQLERIDSRRALRDFNENLALVQPRLPVIDEKGEIQNTGGKTQSTYAKYEDIIEGVLPIISPRGFSLSFRTAVDWEKKICRVRCLLRHSGGHVDENAEIELPFETSGSKNIVQASKSSISYGKRITATAALNIVSRKEDDDGQGAKKLTGGTTLTQEEAAEINQLILDTGIDIDKVLRAEQVNAVEDILSSNLKRIRIRIIQYGKRVKAVSAQQKQAEAAQ